MADARPSNLKIRVISALVLLPVVLGALWYGGIVFRAFIAVVGLLMMWEWLTLIKTQPLLKLIFSAFALVALIASFRMQTPDDFLRAFAGIIAAFLACMTLGLIFRQKQYNWIGAGVLAAGLPILGFMWLRDMPQGGVVILWLLLVVWSTDIGAYFSGRAIGGPKLAPNISPGKTWAGLFGGMILAVFIGLLVAFWFQYERYVWVAVACIVLAVFAQTGDILESRVKRHFGAKDSGRLIPGHGGIFDRVDGLLLTTPLVAIGSAYLNLAGE